MLTLGSNLAVNAYASNKDMTNLLFLFLYITQNNSDLVCLIQVMCVVFGESPPVYSKSVLFGQPATNPSYPHHGGMQQPGYPQSQECE